MATFHSYIKLPDSEDSNLPPIVYHLPEKTATSTDPIQKTAASCDGHSDSYQGTFHQENDLHDSNQRRMSTRRRSDIEGMSLGNLSLGDSNGLALKLQEVLSVATFILRKPPAQLAPGPHHLPSARW